MTYESPLKAIRAFCIECSGDSAYEVTRCSSETCPLKPFRFGKNPYHKLQLTEEQRKIKSENMKRLLEEKKNKATEENNT